MSVVTDVVQIGGVMRKFSLVVLDWNGTLQDDLLHIYECGVQRIFRHYALPCPTLDDYRNEVTGDFMASFYWPHGISREVTAKDLNAIMAEGFKEKGAPPGLFPDAAKFVEALATRGYALAIVSGYDKGKLDVAVARSGFGHRFFLVSGDVRDKTEAITSILDQKGVSGEWCAVIGDTTEDIFGAKGVGATPFICPRGFHPIEKIEATRDEVPKLVVRDTLLDILPYFP